MTTPRTSRMRTPIGKTNHQTTNSGSFSNSEYAARANSLTYNQTIDSSNIKVSRDKLLPPILPRSRYPTIPPIIEEVKHYPKKLCCPDNWIDKIRMQSWLEQADVSTNFDFDSKEAFTRDFVQRNQHQLWKYDLQYMKMSPQQVCDHLLSNTAGFLSLMRGYQFKERALQLSSSDNMSNTLTSTKMLTLTHREPNYDPFILSLKTSREEREQKMTKTLANNIFIKDNRRGYKHAPEYGNFSNFCSILKTNEGATLQR